jgi:hypothetical protein
MSHQVETLTIEGVASGSDVRAKWWRAALVVGAFVWVPVTLYLLLFAPLPMVHDMVHPVRHAFSFVMCH